MYCERQKERDNATTLTSSEVQLQRFVLEFDEDLYRLLRNQHREVRVLLLHHGRDHQDLVLLQLL